MIRLSAAGLTIFFLQKKMSNYLKRGSLEYKNKLSSDGNCQTI